MKTCSECGAKYHARGLCNNPRCVNPAHLTPGTHQQNMDDRMAAGHYPRRDRAMPTLFDIVEAS